MLDAGLGAGDRDERAERLPGGARPADTLPRQFVRPARRGGLGPWGSSTPHPRDPAPDLRPARLAAFVAAVGERRPRSSCSAGDIVLGTSAEEQAHPGARSTRSGAATDAGAAAGAAKRVRIVRDRHLRFFRAALGRSEWIASCPQSAPARRPPYRLPSSLRQPAKLRASSAAGGPIGLATGMDDLRPRGGRWTRPPRGGGGRFRSVPRGEVDACCERHFGDWASEKVESLNFLLRSRVSEEQAP